jgi:hypothetical protein
MIYLRQLTSMALKSLSAQENTRTRMSNYSKTAASLLGGRLARLLARHHTLGNSLWILKCLMENVCSHSVDDAAVIFFRAAHVMAAQNRLF